MKNFKYFFLFGISFLSAAFLWSIVKIYLPSYPEKYIPKNYSPEFYNINIMRIFTSLKKEENTVTKNKNNKEETLKGIKLKAVYNDGKKAFIVIQDGQKTEFIDLNKEYKGYKLVKIDNSYALFTKNSKKYRLSFENNSKTSSAKTKQTVHQNLQTIHKETLLQYKNNISKIWKEVGIVKTRTGYKVTYVKKGGIFDKLGLKRGDIIIKVNNRPVNNDAEVWNLYNNIDNMDEIEIEIKRNNKTKVMNYEIN